MKQFLSLVFLLCSITVNAQDGTTFDGQGPKTGLKGFLEAGYTVGSDLYAADCFSFMITAGWQFDQCFFVGLGSGENYYVDTKQYAIPIYGDLRFNILDNSRSPFLDIKVGYSIADVEGLYISPSIGCRFGFKNNTAITLGMGYEIQKTNSFSDAISNKSSRIGGLSFKLGFDF